MKYFPLIFKNNGLIYNLSYLFIVGSGIILLLTFLVADVKIIIVGIVFAAILLISIFRFPIIGIALIILFTYTGASRLILPKIFFSTTLITIFAYFVVNLINGSLPIVKVPQNKLIVAFLFIICVSMIFAVFPQETISPFFELIKNLIFFFIFINIVKTRKEYEYLTWVLLLSGAIACLIGLYIIYSTGLGQLFLVKSRFGSVLGNPNWFAGTIVPLIPISFYFTKVQQKIWMKVFLILLIFIYLLSITISLSRSALLATIIILIFIFFQEAKQKKVLLFFPLIFFLSLFFVFPQILERIIERFDLIFSGKDISVNIRFWVLKAGISIFSDHPILGVGIGNFLRLSGQYITLIANKVAHNMYLDIAAETGIFGLAVFISIFGKAIIDIEKGLSIFDKEYSFIARGYSLGLLSYLITGFFVSVHFYFFLWLILGFAVITPIIGKKSNFPEKNFFE